MSTLNTKTVIEHVTGISDEVRAHLLSVVSTRGKYKGYILASAPKDKTRRAVWNAVISYLAPVRCEIGVLMFMRDEQKKIHDEVDKAIATSGLKTFINVSEPNFRWNLYAHRFDTEKGRAAIIKMIDENRL